MRFFVALIIALFCAQVSAQEWEDRQIFNEGAEETVLRVISSTDTDLFAPLIANFTSQNAEIGVEYLVTSTAEIDKILRENSDAYDVAISSAMDLQFKLTNDGYALPLENVSHPEWAQWRQSLFAFTVEPATVVINKAAFEGHPVPTSRQDLIKAMRDRPEIFRGKVGTYDVRTSGLGYLFATQDARTSETFWRLMEVMGALDVKLYCCSGAMIDDLTDGSIAVAYNVLGSYAEARQENEEKFEIIELLDFETTMMRTALVSKNTTHVEAATKFIQAVIDYQSTSQQGTLNLPALVQNGGAQDRNTIALEPALMTFLDTLKRKKFLTEWENALIQN